MRFDCAIPGGSQKLFCAAREETLASRFRTARMGVWFWLFWAAVSSFAAAQNATVAVTNVFAGAAKLDPQYGVGSWIWAAETRDQQTCRFWKRIDLPENVSVASARLTIAADNAYRLFVDGREIGQGVLWYTLTEYDVTRILGPGAHVLAVECFNERLRAGLVAGLRVRLQDGRRLEVGTDQSWKVAPNDETRWATRHEPGGHWAAAVVEAPYREWTLPGGRKVDTFRLPPIQPLTVSFWQSSWFRVVMFSLCVALGVLCLWLLAKLAVYSQAQQVVRRERARIARDIHDDLSSGLTQLVLFGEVARSELPEGSEARRQVAKVCAKARSLSQAMNEVIWMVNSQHDGFRDFTSYLCKYAETFLQGTPIRGRFDIEDETPDLPCDLGVRRNLFLGVKEALNNAVRHSGASELLLRIHWQEHQMLVAIEDNGHGFDPGSARQGNGLANMLTRAAEAGGVCRIVSQPGGGCRVEFCVPGPRAHRPGLRFWGRGSAGSLQRAPAHVASATEAADRAVSSSLHPEPAIVTDNPAPPGPTA
jgi:signal transduction histidine kinase